MKKYKSRFNEEILSAVTEVDTNEMDDQDILRIAVAAELSAINLYRRLATSTSNDKLRKVLVSISFEEKIHIGELETLLRELDFEEADAQIEGAQEVDSI